MHNVEGQEFEAKGTYHAEVLHQIFSDIDQVVGYGHLPVHNYNIRIMSMKLRNGTISLQIHNQI